MRSWWTGRQRTATPVRWRLFVFGACLALAWAVPISYALRFSLPYNASSLSRTATPPLLIFVPEGWGFFTRDPREENMFTYYKNGSGAWMLTSRWSFGFGRHGRIVAREAAMLASGIAADATDCRDDHISCLNDVDVAAEIGAVFDNSRLCGDVGFVWQEPVPWAWARDNVVMPARVVRVTVQC